jgi:hypothetical protein
MSASLFFLLAAALLSLVLASAAVAEPQLSAVVPVTTANAPLYAVWSDLTGSFFNITTVDLSTGTPL